MKVVGFDWWLHPTAHAEVGHVDYRGYYAHVSTKEKKTVHTCRFRRQHGFYSFFMLVQNICKFKLINFGILEFASEMKLIILCAYM